MKLSDEKGIKTTHWLSNMLLRSDDMNIIGYQAYQNITDQMALNATQNTVDEVVSGLMLEVSSNMTCTLSAGGAVSFSGSYMNDDTWSFDGTAGNVFSVIVPSSAQVAFDNGDATNPRIDVLEIRPVRTLYNEESRQFKDPITGNVTSALTYTRYEYGYEFQILKGTPASSPTAPTKTSGWIKIAEVYIEANATALGAEKIATVSATSEWETEQNTIIDNNKLTTDVWITLPSSSNIDSDFNRLVGSVPRDLNGHSIYFRLESNTYNLGDYGGNIKGFKNGIINITGTGTTSGVPNTVLTTSGSGIGLLNFRDLHNVHVTVTTLKLDNGALLFEYNNGSHLTVEGTMHFDISSDVSAHPAIYIEDCLSVDLSNCTIFKTGTASRNEAMGIVNVPTVINLPELDSTAVAGCKYSVYLVSCKVHNSSNIVSCINGAIEPSSKNYVLFDGLNYEVVTANKDLEVNKKYLITNDAELTLPSSASIGDTLNIFSITDDTVKIIQDDTQHILNYKDTYLTTQGASGYCNLLNKEKADLIYLGSQELENNELPNPATLPTSAALHATFSSDSTYMALAVSSSPYIVIYKRNGDTFTKLPNPSTLPTGAGKCVEFSHNDTYLSIAHSSSPYVTIYKRSGDTFTKLPNPSTLPAGYGESVVFSDDDTYMVVGHESSPYITIYKRSGDTFTKLSNPSSLPPHTGWGVDFSPNGFYLAVSTIDSPYITIYKRSGDTFTKLSNPSTLPGSYSYGVHFSPDSIYMAVADSGSSHITIYKRSGDTFTKLPNPSPIPPGITASVMFSPDNKYLAANNGSDPYYVIYRHDGDSFTKHSELRSPPSDDGTRSVSYSPDNQYLLFTCNVSPYLYIYKRSMPIDKMWSITNFELSTVGADENTIGDRLH